MRRLAPTIAVLLAACGASPAADPCALETPGARWLAFAARRSGSYDVHVARADGTCERPLSTDPAMDLAPSWGRAGRIAFASDRGGAQRIWIHDLAAGTEAPLDTGALAAAAPAFSPDGRWIAFEGREPGAATVDVHVVPAAGGGPVAITADASDDTGPAWSPDGGTIYFVSSRLGPFEVFSAPAGGGDAVQVTSGSRIIGHPVASPDGAALYFARRMAGTSATEVVRFDLAAKTSAVVSGPDEAEPAVSPDGALLALRSFRFEAGNADVVVLAADGSAPVRVTRDPATDGAPAFAP